MGRFEGTILAVFVLVVVVAAKAAVAGIGSTYDMSRMLSQPHPLAGQMGTRWDPVIPGAQPYVPTPAPVSGAAPQPVTKPAPVAGASVISSVQPSSGSSESMAKLTSKGGYGGWLSEIRVGALKHSAAISTNTPKETGIDANVEILFVSPDFLKVLWSPRPHIGASFNTSSSNTDQVYGGLTWEWIPIDWLFLDFSLGLSGHNGRLNNDGVEADAGRRREFGCRVLARESIELGFILGDRHSLSAVWDHISHAGFCDDENEGMDNAGIRYGYRF
jgi:lipid A 3-O-deacylase